jgi:aspartate kinase
MKARAHATPEDRQQTDSRHPQRAFTEGILVEAVTWSVGEAKIAVRILEDTGSQAKVFRWLADAGIVIDVIAQVTGSDGPTDLTFTLPMTSLDSALAVIHQRSTEVNLLGGVHWERDLSKVSLLGVGMRSHAGVALRVFQILAELGIRIHIISTSEIRISVVIAACHRQLAVNALRAGFGLAEPLLPLPAGE